MAINTNFQTFTTQERLDAVRHAIMLVLVGGKAYGKPSGDSFTRADLKDLRDMEQELVVQIAAESSATGMNVALVARGERV
jgi:hypothetical protein